VILSTILQVNFRELRKGEVRRTPQSGSKGTAPRGTITPPSDQQEEEAIDRGFLEEALARPGG
jgi:hypothetical protein